ncbi:MAG TPA: IPTL-CTERM sorting domain-containing protein [Brevundimonas sp.]
MKTFWATAIVGATLAVCHPALADTFKPVPVPSQNWAVGWAADNTICSNIGDLELELSQPVVAIANGIPRPLTLDSVERHTIGGTPAIVAQFNEPPNPGENKITSMTVGGRSFLTCDGHIFPLPGYVAPEPVPTLTEWAMIFLAALLAGAAALDLQRRRRPA